MLWGYILIFLIILPISLWSLSTALGFLRGNFVPYVPLNKKQLNLLRQNVKLDPEDSVVDLGCGDGRVMRLFEKEGAKNVSGYEINFWAYLKAQIVNSLLKSYVKVYYKNFNKINLEQYNVVFCYLWPSCLNKLRTKFDRELKLGTKVISFSFPIENWREPKVIYTNSIDKQYNRIFIYYI